MIEMTLRTLEANLVIDEYPVPAIDAAIEHDSGLNVGMSYKSEIIISERTGKRAAKKRTTSRRRLSFTEQREKIETSSSSGRVSRQHSAPSSCINERDQPRIVGATEMRGRGVWKASRKQGNRNEHT